MTDLDKLKFYRTHEHDCSYLPDRQAMTLFADPEANLNNPLYSQLTHLGFRRSGEFIYRPHCQHCQACIPVRLQIDHFKPSRSQKRIIKKNRDLQVRIQTPRFEPAYFTLYQRYIAARHADGDMYPATEAQFQSFLLSRANQMAATQVAEFYLADQLVAMAFFDTIDDGLSAIYTFFEPDMAERSLGSFAILWQIEHCLSLDLPYLYLGFWIASCDKMKYKNQFQPLEYLIAQQWQTQS